MSKKVVGTVKIKSGCSHILKENLDRISVLFSADLDEHGKKSDGFVLYDVLLNVPGDVERSLSPDFLSRLQVSRFRATANLGRYFKSINKTHTDLTREIEGETFTFVLFKSWRLHYFHYVNKKNYCLL